MAGQKAVKQKKMRNVNNAAYYMILPFIIVFLIFSIYPVFRTLYLSFTDYKGYGTENWIGIQNYIRVFKDQYFWNAFINTARIWGVNIVLQLGLAFALTIVFNDMKYRIKGLSIFRAIFYLPSLISATSIAFLFKTLLDWKYGTFNQILMNLHIISQPVDWLGNQQIAPYTISVIQTWIWFGNSFLMLMAGVQGISKDYYEAASIDGAGRMKLFTKITLPLLKPILLYVTITSLIGGLQMFDMPFLMSDGNIAGRMNTMVMYLYRYGFTVNQVGYSGAIAYVLFIIILIFSIAQFVISNRKED